MINTRLVAPLVIGAGLFGGGWYVGSELREKSELERAAAIEQAVRIASDKTADAISKIKVENRTLVKNFKEVEKRVPVYVDCKHDPDAVKLLNNLLTDVKPSLQSELP